MANKILMVYAAADALFLIMGIILLGFSIVVQNTMTEGFTDGEQAARNLMYRKFPLNAAIGNAIMVIITFLTTVPALFMKTRRLLVISGYMVTFCTIYTLVIGISLWILTLKTKDEFFNIWVSQPSQVQELWQTSVSDCRWRMRSEAPFADRVPSSNVAAISTARRRPSSRTRRAPAQLPRR